MADGLDVKVNFASLVRENWSGPVYDLTFAAMPLVGIFAGRYGDKKAEGGGRGLGIPDSGVLLTGMKKVAVLKPEIMSATIWNPPQVISLPAESDGKPMPFGATTPQVANWPNSGAENRNKRAAFKWFPLSDPCQVDQDRIDHTTSVVKGETEGWEAIQSLMHEESVQRMGVHLQRLDSMWHGTYAPTDGRFSNTGAPSNYSNETLDALDSFATIASATNTYGEIDRTVTTNAYWKGNTITTATAPSFRDMLRFSQNQLYGTGANGAVTGLSSLGARLDVMLVSGDMFTNAQNEADAKMGGLKYIEAGSDIPQMGLFGVKTDIVLVDGKTAIVNDPSMPSGQVVGLNLSTFFLALHPKGNFNITEPTYLGDRPGNIKAMYWNIETKMMFGCLAPKIGIVMWTNVA